MKSPITHELLVVELITSSILRTGIMMDKQDSRLRKIWLQTEIPVIYRQTRPYPVLVRLPYSVGNYKWVRGDARHKPKWDPKYKCWETPVSWFDDLIQRSLKRFGKVYVVQLHKEHQKCAPACWDAKGFHCECSCMGENHGSGHLGGNWHEVSETFAFQWGPRQYACRLIAATKNTSQA